MLGATKLKGLKNPQHRLQCDGERGAADSDLPGEVSGFATRYFINIFQFIHINISKIYFISNIIEYAVIFIKFLSKNPINEFRHTHLPLCGLHPENTLKILFNARTDSLCPIRHSPSYTLALLKSNDSSTDVMNSESVFHCIEIPSQQLSMMHRYTGAVKQKQ